MIRRLESAIGYYPWLYALVFTLVLNLAFLVLSLSSNLVPQDAIVERIRDGFATGELIEQDYLRYDIHRGSNQYNDCNILQMMTNPDSSATGRALGPWLHLPSSMEDACRTLRELVVDERNPESLVSFRYTRYWHGYIPVGSALLTVLDISTTRALLRALVIVSVLFLAVAGVLRRRFLPLAGAVAVAGAVFWGLPYFGQGLSRALADSAVMLGIACLIFWHRKFARLDILLPFCASYGAVVVYFEMLTGPLPTAAGLLFPTVYIISRLNNDSNMGINYHIGLATAAVVAFGLGAALTLGVRVVVSAMLVGSNGLDAFFGNLAFYSQAVENGFPIPGFLQPLGRLVRRGAVLTYGSDWGLVALYVSATAAIFASLWITWQRGSRLAWADLTAFAIGAGFIAVWTFVLPTHTYMHAGMMARILVVPISLSWAALLWQLRLMRQYGGNYS